MADLQVWTVGDINPSISNTITVGGSPVNLSSSSVVFKMRPVGSTTLKVNAAATVVSPTSSGVVRYDWLTADVDTAGQYICWWEVTTSGAVQSVGEEVIEFRAHAPVSLYVELEQLKESLNLKGQNYADHDIQASIVAAQDLVENICGRVFTTGATAVKYYTPQTPFVCAIDDITSVSELAIDTGWNGTFSTVLSTSAYDLGPFNNPAINWPYEVIQLRPWNTAQILYDWVPRSVRVTGTFGWPVTPPAIKDAVSMLANRFIRRKREAPFGIMTVGMESQRAIRISQSDPDVYQLLQGYIKARPFI